MSNGESCDKIVVMKYRLDQFIVMKGLQESRERAKRAIVSGQVFVDGQIEKSPARKISGDEIITFGEGVLKYVSRGALKLVKAAEEFGLDFSGRVVLDIGSSTGGFTEVALENGAKKVIALDVGTKVLHEKLRKDERVVSLENTDFRFVESEKIDYADMIVTDVSFISLRLIFPKIIENFGKNIEIVALFKPQFECGETLAKKFNGVIRNSKIHKELLGPFFEYLNNFGFKITGFTYSPITGKEGNIEYLLHLNGKEKGKVSYEKVVDTAFENL